MMTRLLLTNLCLVPTLGAFLASAQDEDPLNRFSFSYRMGLNIKAEFKNLGLPALPGGPSVTGLSYADGFVRPNSEPNDLGLSWNWGYEDSRQWVGDYIVLTRSQAGQMASGVRDEPYNGGELTYNRQLGREGAWRWGVEAAVNCTSVDIGGGFTPAGSVLTAHGFSLGGSIPPVAPYAGSPEGPGMLISDTPTMAMLTVDSSIKTDLIGFRLGPYLEYAIGDHWLVSASLGLALGWADSDFNFTESVNIDGAQGVLRGGSGSKSELLPGSYVAGSVLFRLTDGISLFGSAQFQSLVDQSVQAGNYQVKLELSQSVFVAVGLNFSF